MKLTNLVVLASFSIVLPTARAADATTTVAYAQRNDPFAPAGTVVPEKKSPQVDTTVQEKRFDKTIVDKKSAAVGDRRAAIEIKESREKDVREKDSHRPEAVTQPTSPFNHREAGFSTATDTKKPPMVSKYQDSLVAASASNMARFPALDGATGAKINRFVFRKNGSEDGALTTGAPVTPAGGGSAPAK